MLQQNIAVKLQICFAKFLKLLATFRQPVDELITTECSLDKPCTGISVNLISTPDPQE